MRIESIEAIPVEIPLRRNFGGSTYAVVKRSTIVTRLRTDAGLFRWVCTGDTREHGAELARLVHETLAPRVKGLSIFEGDRIWETMFALGHTSRRRKLLMEAIACVDCAVWDVVGKARGQAVCELLGGAARARPVLSIGGYYADGKRPAGTGRE